MVFFQHERIGGISGVFNFKKKLDISQLYQVAGGKEHPGLWIDFLAIVKSAVRRANISDVKSLGRCANPSVLAGNTGMFYLVISRG
jgi:hypothetical protein